MSRTTAPAVGAPRSGLGVLYAVSAGLTALICGPLVWGAVAGEQLLHRDAVSSPRFPWSTAAFGIDGAPPRAIPQDGVLALLSTVVDGGLLVVLITCAALVFAGVGYGRLARELVPEAGLPGALAAATVAIWNPFVAERLLQGHWSLLTGYAALGWLILGVRRSAAAPGWTTGAIVAGLLAVAGFTPTGSLLGLIVALVTVAAVPAGRGRTALLVVGAWLLTALPWLVAAAVSEAPGAAAGGAELFAARAEPGLGTVGSLVGLGGIWNAEAVPTSRTSWWAAVATAALSVLLILGLRALWRARGGLERLVPVLGLLAGAVVISIAVAATGPGLDVLDAVLRTVPGSGLLRDSQKYLALAMPFVALTVAAATGWLRGWVPTGFALAAVVLLAVAPLPDLAWGAGGKLRTVELPADYAAVSARIGDDPHPVALWPADTVRSLPWNHAPSLSPLPRMLDAPVLTGSALVVDGVTVDAPTEQAAAVERVLAGGGDPERLAALGIGWVIVENGSAPAVLASTAPPVFDGAELHVYRIDDPAPLPGPGAAAWTGAILAHGIWLAAVLAGIVAAGVQRARRTRSKPSAVDSQE